MKRSQQGVVYFTALSLALFACGGDGNGNEDGGGGGGDGSWHAIKLPNGQSNNDVLGVYCTSTSKCVVATSYAGNGADPAGVFAASDTAVGDLLVDSAQVIEKNHLLSMGINFIGFQHFGNKLMARMNTSAAYVTATGDITQKASWTIAALGNTSDGENLGLSMENVLQSDANGQNWIFINLLGVYSSTMAPSSTTTWTETWYPRAPDPVPQNFEQMHTADPTLCDSDVSAGGLPNPANANWVAPDLSMILLTAGGLNQDGSAEPGVCISTDKGLHFYNVPFSNLPMGTDVSHAGPKDVTCLDKDHCFAFSGLPEETGTAYIYRTENASAVKGSTWMRATVPTSWATSNEIVLQAMFFAPDGMHGWVVGYQGDHHPLLVRTSDGGHTWTDISSSVPSSVGTDLYSGFALDKDHVMIGGRFGTLFATDSAQK